MRIALFPLLLTMAVAAHSQPFKNENKKFTTVYPQDLCAVLKKNAGYVFLDVRTAGEFNDSSSSASFNMGHLKDARHIPVAELGRRWREWEDVKDKPVFVYCSHSQRSRRASALLADSGFTRVFNINGGMSDIIYSMGSLASCFRDIYTNRLPYRLISAENVIQRSQQSNPFFIIDIRSDSLFRGISTQEKRNAIGRLAPSVNLLPDQFASSLSTVSHNQPILIVDENGDESPRAAEILKTLGFRDIYVLFNGMSVWMDAELGGKHSDFVQWKSPAPYHIITPDELGGLAARSGSVIIDTRPVEVFENKSKNNWENIGHIKGAVNIPAETLLQPGQLPPGKQTTLILYHFSNQNEVYETARRLYNLGYTDVNVLRNGIWNLRWAAYNRKGKTAYADWVVDIPEENR